MTTLLKPGDIVYLDTDSLITSLGGLEDFCSPYAPYRVIKMIEAFGVYRVENTVTGEKGTFDSDYLVKEELAKGYDFENFYDQTEF